ncbi:uncharacterized protein [Tiliqua scincoides]|uniref:uncharacterized protein n=1 Tax=Tiliqua scincoides TaxID=71010 RepID=UPI003461EA69
MSGYDFSTLQRPDIPVPDPPTNVDEVNCPDENGTVPQLEDGSSSSDVEVDEPKLFSQEELNDLCTISTPKKGNVERHFRTVHGQYDTDFPLKSELRKRKVNELKSQSPGRQTFFTQHSSKAKAATEASFRVSHIIVNNKKSFQDGEMVKEAFVEAADALFQDFKNKAVILSSIKALQLSRSTVTRRCEAMAEDVTQQMWKDIGDCVSHCSWANLLT